MSPNSGDGGTAGESFAHQLGDELNLRAQVLNGLLWTGGTRLLSQIFTWAVTIVVLRLLTPSDYGLLAMAMVFIGFLTLMASAGLGPALIQATEISDRTLRQVFG